MNVTLLLPKNSRAIPIKLVSPHFELETKPSFSAQVLQNRVPQRGGFRCRLLVQHPKTERFRGLATIDGQGQDQPEENGKC